MKCGDIMSTNLEWLTEQDTIDVAASKMAEAGVGFLPICDAEKRVVGVVTDRDLVTRGIAKRVTPSTTAAAVIMSSPALTCLQTTELGDAEDLMATNQKSRLIITDGEARLVGVLSLVDLLEHAPTARALQTTRAVLWREALGPRGGSAPGRPLLKDDPVARASPSPSDTIEVHPSAIKGGNHSTGTKEFPS
jgi:CBS domain-containing protein